MSVVRMRFPQQALEELRRIDPQTPVSLSFIRRLVKSGAVPSVPVGNDSAGGRAVVIEWRVLMCRFISPMPNSLLCYLTMNADD